MNEDNDKEECKCKMGWPEAISNIALGATIVGMFFAVAWCTIHI